MTFGPGYVDALVAIGDAPAKAETLELLVPLDGRWPEPRVLDQREVWFSHDRAAVAVASLDKASAKALLAELRSLAGVLHAAAVRDERLLSSSGVRRAWSALGVALVEDLEPLAWLNSTTLARALARKCG